MCRFTKADNTQCRLSPKKDLCHKHINSVAEPIAEPIAEEPIAEEPIAEEPIVSASAIETLISGCVSEKKFASAEKSDVKLHKKYSFLRITTEVELYYVFFSASDAENAAECLKRELPDSIKIGTILRTKKTVAIDMDDPYDTAAAAREEQKKDKPELISTEAGNVETNIVPPMSPNATSASVNQPDSTIVEETKPAPVKNISIFAKCRAFLTERDNGRWEETYRFKDKETGKYLHPLMREMSLLRVEDEGIKKAGGKGHCRFYWIYKPIDARLFVEHVGLRLRGECHEIIVSPRCRFFFDIDFKLDVMEKCDIADAMGFPLEEDGDEIKMMDKASSKLAELYAESIKISLEENSALEELDRFDWMATTRNRKLDNDGFKISIHLITNLMLPHEVCAAIAHDIQTKTIAENTGVLDISEPIADLITGAIDPAQYRKHGSLGLAYGVKNGNQSLIVRGYAFPGQSYFLTKGDQWMIEDVDTKSYDIKAVSTFTAEANGDFVKQALAHADKIPDYSKNVFDLSVSRLRGSCMIAKRCAPSNCSICNRRHDNDNTLKLFFNSDKGFATWNCIRSKAKSKTFFRIEEPVATPADDDIEAFSTKSAKAVAKAVAAEKAKAADSEPQGVLNEKLYDLLSLLDAKRFIISNDRSPLFGVAVAVRDYSKVPPFDAKYTLSKVASEKLTAAFKQQDIDTAWKWTSRSRDKDLTMASIRKFAKADNPDRYKALTAKGAESEMTLEMSFEKTFESKLIVGRIIEMLACMDMTFVEFKTLVIDDEFSKVEFAFWFEKHITPKIKNSMSLNRLGKFRHFEQMVKTILFADYQIAQRFISIFIHEYFLFFVSDSKRGYIKRAPTDDNSNPLESVDMGMFANIRLKIETDKGVSVPSMKDMLSSIPYHQFEYTSYIWNMDPNNRDAFSMAYPFAITGEGIDAQIELGDLPQTLVYYLKMSFAMTLTIASSGFEATWRI